MSMLGASNSADASQSLDSSGAAAATHVTNNNVTLLQDRIKPATLIKVGYGDGIHGNNSIPPRFVVGYWSMRGLGAPVRMMLSAAHAHNKARGGGNGVPHWVALYDVVEEHDATDEGWSFKSWIYDKEWMMSDCNPFMNLPYLIDVKEQYVLTQSNAILSYLGRELGMMGSTKLEMAKCDELLSTIYDLRDTMVHFAYYGTPTAEECWATAQKHFQNLETHLSRQMREYSTVVDAVNDDVTVVPNYFLMGTTTTAPDFPLYEMLDQYEMLAKQHGFASIDTKYPILAKYKSTMEELPEHQDYLNSFLHQGLPLNNPYARFASSLSAMSYERGQETPWRNLGIVVLDSNVVKKRPPPEEESCRR